MRQGEQTKQWMPGTTGGTISKSKDAITSGRVVSLDKCPSFPSSHRIPHEVPMLITNIQELLSVHSEVA